MPDRDDYALKSAVAAEVAAPVLAYQPPLPKLARPRIALVGAGGISFAHLDAYHANGFDVAAICSRDMAKAVARRDEFYPDADVTTDYPALLRRADIDVVDLTPHPAERVALTEAALRAGKHVLSQKPFVTDLGTGERLCDLADEKGLRLAVNQNGRWAPHMAWMRAAVQAGLIGDLLSVHCAIHWDHRWIAGTPFEDVHDIVLYDFGIHWFDFVTSLTGRLADGVLAQTVRGSGQTARPPLLASALMDFGDAQASLIFDATAASGALDTTYVAGTKGSLMSRGPNLGEQAVELHTAAGVARPALRGTWFNDGFAGAMGELLCAVEDGREPSNGGRANLMSLANCFAAAQAARTGARVAGGSVRALPGQDRTETAAALPDAPKRAEAVPRNGRRARRARQK